MKNFAFTFCLPAVVPLAVLALWQVAAPIIDNNMVLPPVRSVLDILLHPTASLLSMGPLIKNIAMSLIRVLVAYLIAAPAGVFLGVAMGYSLRCERFCGTFIELFRPLPPLAWVPLILGWCGMFSLAGLARLSSGPLYPYLDSIKLSMLFILFIGAFFPIVTESCRGVRGIRRQLSDSARVLGASEGDVFWKVLLPGATPGICNGMRIGLALSWSCLISAEMLPGSTSGVGYLIIHAYSMGRVDIVIAGMLCIGATGALLDWGFRSLEEKKLAWSKRTR